MPETPRERLFRWRADPLAFVRENFHAEPDEWQADVLRAFPNNQRLALKACKGPGKTCVLAWLIWNFLATRLHPKIACTSISADNLQDGLWTELALWKAKSPFLDATFDWQKTRIICKDYPETWWCSARSWSQSADQTRQADTLAGLHADNLLFVIDEAGGVPDGVASAAEAGLATVGGDKRLVIAGNPTTLGGPLYRASTSDRHLWHVTEITSDPDDPKRTPRVSVQWAREQIATYGKDNPWVLVNVFGRFPPASLNSLLGPDDVTAAFNRVFAVHSQDHCAKLLGLDVARFGDDRTVFIHRRGQTAHSPWIMRGARATEVADRAIYEYNEHGCDALFVDSTGGHGNGVIDICQRAGLRIIEVNFSDAAADPMYFNKRSEIWYEMSKWAKTAQLPNIPELVKELSAPTFIYIKDKFRMEEKDQIKKRLGYSPDIGDALATTFACPIAPASGDEMMEAVRGRQQSFDPLGRVGKYGR